MSIQNVMPPKQNELNESFSVKKPIFGVIHLMPLPGAPSYRGENVRDIYAAGVRDALTLKKGGVDAIFVENAGDQPFLRPDDIGPETVAALTAACLEIRNAIDLPMGITCVANGALQAIAVGKAVGAKWVRVNQWANAYVANEGLLNGNAALALRFRNAIGANDIKILADVHVKFGSHAITSDRTIAEQAADAEWHHADVLIASGVRTGDPTSFEEVAEIKSGTNLPVLVGSGISPKQIPNLFNIADGAIVGQWLKEEGKWWNPVDPVRVDELMKVVDEFRAGMASRQ
jgi:hypothetical protein